jgi:lysophospholipase L1-like esterase
MSVRSASLARRARSSPPRSFDVSPPPAILRETLGAKLRRIAKDAIHNNPWDNAVMASPPTVTPAASADAGATNLISIRSNLSVCRLLGATWTDDGSSSMVPSTTTRNDASKFAYSGVIEFETDSPIVSVGLQTSGISCLIEVDGYFASKTPTTRSGSGTQYVNVTFGSSARRLLRLHAAHSARFIGLPAIYRAWQTSQSDIIRAVITGDSYTASTGVDGVALSWANIFGLLMGWRDVRACGIGGTGYIAPGGGTAWKCRDHISDITGVSPDVVVFAHGTNDAVYSASDITAEALLNYQAVRSALPNALIIVLGAWPQNSGPSFSILTVENAISAAVSQFGDDNCLFVPVSTFAGGSWVFGTGKSGATNGTGNADLYQGGTTGSDGVHPNQAGHLYLAQRAASAVRNALTSVR